MAASVEAALTAKLKADSGVSAIVGARVFPQLDTQESAFPAVVYTKLGAEGSRRLSGDSGLKAYTVQIDCYAETEAGAVALANAVTGALAPCDSDVWVDKAAGVHGAFQVDSASGFTEDGYRYQSVTFQIWFRPTS